ncbi:MAG: hypothetical protein EOO38_31300 [Cytophagaceae bacterium]|nr:MAG: hypothetical protein EOO38_31300 [Cytophagaceae bacterium]
MLQLRLATRRLNAQYGEGVLDVRCALGIGPAGAAVTSVRTATGPAFLLSGRSLDALAGSSRHLSIVSANSAAQLSLDLVARFTDYLVQRLTGRQSEVIFELLKGNSQTEAGKKLDKAPATISQHVHAGGWNELEQLITDYERVLTQHALR